MSIDVDENNGGYDVSIRQGVCVAVQPYSDAILCCMSIVWRQSSAIGMVY